MLPEAKRVGTKLNLTSKSLKDFGMVASLTLIFLLALSPVMWHSAALITLLCVNIVILSVNGVKKGDIFSSLDADGNGAINEEELQGFVRETGRDNPYLDDNSEIKLAVQTSFRSLDADGDHTISADELGGYLDRLAQVTHQHATPPRRHCTALLTPANPPSLIFHRPPAVPPSSSPFSRRTIHIGAFRG